jgi:hypothetical protein
MDASIDGLRGVQIAASDAGVDAGQLGSSLQMLNSRLAEAARGTGTAVNALERLGLSAQDLMRMDVDQRMATIADAMKAQGMSAGQATDALRELGVRSRKMSLLMIQGGDAIRNARQEVDQLGLSISAVDAAKIEIANDAMSRIGMLMSGIQQQFVIGMSTSLTALSQMFASSFENTDNLADIVEQVIDKIVLGTISASVRLGRFMDPIKTAVSSLWESFTRLPTFAQEMGILGSLVFGMKGIAVVALATKALDDTKVTAEWWRAYKDKEIGFFEWLTTGNDEARQKLKDMERNIEGFGRNAPEGGGPSLFGSLFENDEENEPPESAQEQIDRLIGEYLSLKRAAEDSAQAQAQSLTAIPTALEDAVVTATRVIKEDLSQAQDVMSEFGKQAARNIQSSFADFLFDPFKDGLKGMLRGFADMLRHMVAELIAKQLLLSFFGGFAGKGGFMGGIADGLLGKQKGGPVNSNMPYMVGERGPELMIPKASGTIIPNHKLGGGQSTSVTVNINAEDPGAEGRIRTMIEQDMAPQIVQAAVGKTFGLMQRPSFA